jgi:RND family efflux transporter MFP subunit
MIRHAYLTSCTLLIGFIIGCLPIYAESLPSVLQESYRGALTVRQTGPLRLLIKEGDRVTVGQTLFEVGTAKLQLRIQLAELQHQKAQANLQRTLTPKTERELALARFVFRLQEELYHGGGISRDAFAKARLTYELALEPQRPVDIDIARLTVEERKIEVDLLQSELNEAVYTSPADGQITKVHVLDGQWVDSGQKIVDIINIHPLLVAITVPLKRLQVFSAEMPLSLSIDTGQGQSNTTGTITFISDELDGFDQQSRILLQIDNEKHQFKPGMRVLVQMP